LILSPLDDLLTNTPEGQERDVLKTVRRNGVRLLRLIDDLLDLARLEAGGLRLQVARLDVAELARSVVEACAPTADARSIQLSLTARGRCGAMFGDRHRLEMVLTNLVGNALKFTPTHGRIEISVEEDGQGARVSVADTGPGIPSGDLPRIFERFYQVQGDSQAPRGGAGIGLALARELTERHGGTLTVDSQLGQGATFTLWLPAGRDSVSYDAVERRRAVVPTRERRRAEDQASIDPLPPSSAPKLDRPASEPILLEGGRRAHIVVAEDDSELRQFVCSVLEPDFETLRASDGNQALSLTRAETPDLVLTDLMMPGLSGIELCRQIKADPALRHTPVILLTARSGSESTLEGYAAGADDFVIKPFHTRVLVARVTAQLRLRALSLQLAAQAQLISTTTLAAGLSHEVRNPLNALINSVRVLQDASRAADLPATTHRLLAVIQDSSHRILDVVDTLDAHARPADAGSVAPCDVRAGIDSTLRLLEHRLDGIQVHRDYSGTQLILAPSGEINIVFANLLENAIRSRPSNVHISVNDREQHVRIVISDDGAGVPPNIAARIFDPFFTTRPVGEGTGLGLYLCRRLVTERGGTLRHEHRPGGGASFVIEIPTEYSSRVPTDGEPRALPA
jgi:signal transduction histidine kinase